MTIRVTQQAAEVLLTGDPKVRATQQALEVSWVPAISLAVEERRRLKILPNAFGEKAVLKLMFGAMARAAERWR